MPSAARLGDNCAGYGCFPATPIIAGSGDVIINGKLAARVGDAIGCGGSVAAGSGDVIVGSTPYQSPVKACAEQSAKNRAPLLALTPMLLPTLMEWALAAELPIVDELLTLAQRKDRYLARAKLATEATSLPGLVDAAKRLVFNNDNILRAEAAQYVYSVDEFRRGVMDKLPKAPGGLELLDTSKLPGFAASDFTDSKAGFGAALLKSAVSGETMLTYRGTNNAVTGVQDWVTNASQGMGMKSNQYNQAMYLATKIKDVISPAPIIVGHSLGGGLTSGAGVLIGGNAGAVIGGVMSVVKLLDGALPKASGEMLSLPDSGGSPLARHGMDQVIAGIENQKKEDIGQITSTFGGM